MKHRVHKIKLSLRLFDSELSHTLEFTLMLKNKMNKLVCILLIAVSLSWSNSRPVTKYFEGAMTYKSDIVVKNPQIDSSLIRNILGAGSTLFFKDGNYLLEYNGGLLKRQLYRKQDNKIYIRKNKNDTTFWVDCGNAGEEVIKFSLTRKKEKILGVECDELVIFYNDKTVSDYFNSALFRTNPAWFKNFKYENQNIIEEKEQAVCLKHKTEYPDFTIISTAITFSKKKIDDRIFKISSDEILAEEK
jgi:hypothetical protein